MFKMCGRRWEVKVHRYEELLGTIEECVKNVHEMEIESDMKWRSCLTHVSNAWSSSAPRCTEAMFVSPHHSFLCPSPLSFPMHSLHSFPCSPQMAYVASSPVFSDKERYPNFFRAIPPEPPIPFGEGILIDHFKWTEVAYIAQNEHIFSCVSEPNMIHP